MNYCTGFFMFCFVFFKFLFNYNFIFLLNTENGTFSNISPDKGSDIQPTTFPGIDGPNFLILFPYSSNIILIFSCFY